MNTITVIGDVHGLLTPYFKIVEKCDYSIQVGDFGFANEWTRLHYSNLDSNRHKIVPGNHDDYDVCQESPYCLKDFGVTVLNGVEIFHIRGGISIDRTYRDGERINGGKTTYWHEEELNFDQMLECLSLYQLAKPDIVISHAPPAVLISILHEDQRILKRFGFKENFIENTSRLGNQLLAIHKPKKWIFGHHHVSYRDTIDGVEYIGLDELETAQI